MQHTIDAQAEGVLHGTQSPEAITDSEKTFLWERWQQGESIHQIARLLDRKHSSIRQVLARTGGIRPAARHRSPRALTLVEREEISRSVAAGCSLRSIAQRLCRAPSTISREVQRNGGRDGYRANQADQRAWDKSRRPKICKLRKHRVLAKRVAAKLQRHWSPVQIAGWLKQHSGGHEEQQVSHETIYRSLFIQARGALKKELLVHLRRTRAMRRSRHHTQKTADHGQLTGMVSIRERPADTKLRNTGRTIPAMCCVDRLKSQPKADIRAGRLAGVIEGRAGPGFRHGHSRSGRKKLPVDDARHFNLLLMA